MSTDDAQDQTDQKAELVSFRAELTFELNGMPLMDNQSSSAHRQFQFDPSSGKVIFAVDEGNWVVHHATVYGPRRLANNTNSSSTSGMITWWPRETGLPDWLHELIEKHGVHQFPQRY